jgi:hypothetical protein
MMQDKPWLDAGHRLTAKMLFYESSVIERQAHPHQTTQKRERE